MTPTSDPGTLLEQLADRYWETAARHAWSQYKERGRGAIVFSLQQSESQEKEPLRYLTFSGDPDEIAQSTMAMLHTLVEDYDPHAEVVIAAVLPDGRTVFDVFDGSPAPAALK